MDKMNARNIAMVFAPNMTKMADPLTALIHAVQVMNPLKTLILKTIREREEELDKSIELLSCSTSHSHEHKAATQPKKMSSKSDLSIFNTSFSEILCRNNRSRKKYHSFDSKDEIEENGFESVKSTPSNCNEDIMRDEDGIMDRFNFREGIKRICRTGQARKVRMF